MSQKPTAHKRSAARIAAIAALEAGPVTLGWRSYASGEFWKLEMQGHATVTWPASVAIDGYNFPVDGLAVHQVAFERCWNV